MDVPDLACCTVEYVHGSQHDFSSDRFAIEDRLILHRAYAKADNRQLISLFSHQLAYFCALQGSTRQQMIEVAAKLVKGHHGNDLQIVLRKRLLDLVSEDFHDCRNALNLCAKSASFLTGLTARAVKAISESVQQWAQSSNNQALYDHIRKALHENADRLNPHQRRQAVMDVEKWFSDSLMEVTMTSSSLSLSDWEQVISFAGYKTAMKTIRCLNRSLFFACHQLKAWKDVKYVDLDFIWIPSTQEDIALLFRRMHSLLSLRCIRDPGRLTAETVFAMAEYCPRLEEVWLEGWTCLTDDLIEMLAKSCPMLKLVTLDSCNLLTDRGLAALAKNCPHIESLSLNWCPKITLFPILSPGVFKNLRSLSVANANERNPDILSDSAFARALRVFAHLDRFVYSGRTQLDDRGLATLAVSKLTYLDCSNITSVTDAWILRISKVCPNLKFVNVSKCHVARMAAAESAMSNLDHVILENCNMVSNEAVHNLANCRKMSVLNLAGCTSLTDPAFSKLPQDWRSVRVLCLDRCSSLTDKSVSGICKRMPFIESLSLQNLRHIGNSSISTIVSSLSKLAHLNISGCYRVTDAGIGFLGSSKCSMRSLTISNLSSITDLAMQSLVSFGLLEHLDVSGCCGITYEGILILCSGLFRNSVKTLSIARCAGVENDLMKLFGICFPMLQELDVSSCENLSDAGMKSLVSESLSIRSINFSGCTEITEKGARDLLLNAPLLRFVNMSCCPRISSECAHKLRQEFAGVVFVSSSSVLESSVSMKLEAPAKLFHLDRALTC